MFIAFKLAYTYLLFQLRENLDFRNFLPEKFYSIYQFHYRKLIIAISLSS